MGLTMYNKLLASGLAVALLGVTGCVSLPSSNSTEGSDEAVLHHSSENTQELDSSQMEEMLPVDPYTPAYGASVPTPNGVSAGQCWVQTQVQPRASKIPINVIVEEARNKIEVTPADIRRGYRQVVTAEGVRSYKIEPPTYRLVQEQVMVKPELTTFDVIPAVYENREVDVVVTPAKTVVEPCQAAGVTFSSASATQAFCSREIPAVTETVTQRVVVQEEQTQVRFEPAVYETVTRRVVDRPARAVEIMTDEVVDNIPVHELVSQAQTEVIEIPAITKEMQLTQFDGPPRIVTLQAVCNNDLNDVLVRDLQRSLNSKGYNPGPIDGKLGRLTISALEKFQTDNGLGVGALTLESLDALGVSY